MSSTFAIVGSGTLGAFLINEFLTYKASGSVTTLKIISRSVSLLSLPGLRLYFVSAPDFSSDETLLLRLAGDH